MGELLNGIPTEHVNPGRLADTLGLFVIVYIIYLFYFELLQNRIYRDRWDDVLVIMTRAGIPLSELSNSGFYRRELWKFYGIFKLNILAVWKYVMSVLLLLYLVTGWNPIYVIALIGPVIGIVLDKIFYIKLAKAFGKDNSFIIKYILRPGKMIQIIANDTLEFNP